MKIKLAIASIIAIAITGCSVVGQTNVESAPYEKILAADELSIEIRQYDPMILVSTNMNSEGRNDAFRRLFSYITGSNVGKTDIAMTAPVIMNEANQEETKQGVDIAMTAPVFMDENAFSMSFVMPKHFTLDSTPAPTNDAVWVTEVIDYKVAAIQFNGLLSESNIEKHSATLQKWLDDNGYTAIENPVTAAYNGPLTLPVFRKNEVLIQIQ